DRLGKPVQIFLLLARQFDRDEDADMQPKRLLVDGRDIARDHAALFEKLHAAMARRNREANLLGKLLHRGAAITLQNIQDLAVDGIQALHWNKLGIAGVSLVTYP